MQIHIKKALLEGYTPEQIITEAKHAGTPYEKGTPLGTLNRPILARSIKATLDNREYERKKGLHSDANYSDNIARLKSQMSEPREANLKMPFIPTKGYTAAYQQPRLYQAARQ